MAQIDGDLAVLDSPLPYTVYNKILTNWRGTTAPTGALPGLIWSDSDDERLYHITVAGSNQIAQGAIMPVTDGVRLTEPGGADYMDFLLDGSDAFIKWSDGSLTLMTDEDDTNTLVGIKGKGTGYAYLRIFDEDDAEFMEIVLAGGVGYIHTAGTSPLALYLQYNIAQDIKCWPSIPAGNPYFYIYGFKTDDAVKYLRAYVHTDGTPHFDAEIAPITFDDNILVSGAIAVTGTVDGVDVAALKTDVDGFQDELKDLTQVEIQQLELIGATTISAAQWGYLGACGAGGGQLLAGLTAGESTQLEAIGAVTISAAQWGYLGGLGDWLDQSVKQAASPTFAGLTSNGFLNIGSASVTISSNTITATCSWMVLTGEGDTTDSLETINGGSEGDLLILTSATDNAYDIGIIDGTGNIQLNGNETLVGVSGYTLTLIKRGSDWYELSRGW